MAFGTASNAEATLRREFCESITVINNYVDGRVPIPSDTVSGCNALIDRMINNCNSSGNCTTVYANQMCLGGTCYSAKPRWQYDGSCENTQNQGASNSPPSESYTRRLCNPNNPFLIYNPSNGQCCPIRLIQ